MKKIFSIVMGLCAMTTLQAANTEVARITLTGQGGTEASNVILSVDPSISADQLTSYFGATDEVGQVNIYAYKGGTYSAIKSDKFENLELQVITNRRPAANQHYTLTFTVPTLTDGLSLYDRLTDITTPIVNNGKYEFDVNTTLHADYVEGTNYVIADRFIINYVAPAPAAPSICFSNNTLDVLGHAGKTLSVKKVDGTDVIAEQVLASDAEHFDLSAQQADTRLIVTLDGTAYQIDVNPTVTTL